MPPVFAQPQIARIDSQTGFWKRLAVGPGPGVLADCGSVERLLAPAAAHKVETWEPLLEVRAQLAAVAD